MPNVYVPYVNPNPKPYVLKLASIPTRLVDAANLKYAKIYMTVLSVDYFKTGYEAYIDYSYLGEVDSGRKNELGDSIIWTGIPKILGTQRTTFSRAQAEAIETGSGGLTGTFHSDKFDQLILAGFLYKLSTETAPRYGLGVSDWVQVP